MRTEQEVRDTMRKVYANLHNRQKNLEKERHLRDVAVLNQHRPMGRKQDK